MSVEWSDEREDRQQARFHCQADHSAPGQDVEEREARQETELYCQADH